MRPSACALTACLVICTAGLASGQTVMLPPQPRRLEAAPPPVAAPPPARAAEDGAAGLAPLATALKAGFPTFWTVVQAARLEKLFDDPTAEFTVLAPTDAAWLKRLPSLTAGANLTVPQLLSDGRGRVLEQILNYHVLPGRPLESLEQLGLRGRLPTNANSCSTAKNIQVAAVQPSGAAAGQVTLASSLGGTARTAGPPQPVTGGSVIFPIDDVLLPSSVTLPLEAALAGPGALGTSAVDAATLDAVASKIDGKEPLPLTDDEGLAARDKAAEGANAVPLGGGGGGGGGEPAPQQAAAPRRRVSVPTLPAAEEGAAPTGTPAVASLDGGGPTPVLP